MYFKEIDINDVDLLAELFVESFNAAPWNDRWTAETAAKRLTLMADGEAAYGIEAFEDGELCAMALGCMEIYYDGIVYNLREFCVKNSKRGSGLGTKMYFELERRLREKGVKEITLCTLRGQYTEGFYIRQGMSGTDNIVTMGKKLK